MEIALYVFGFLGVLVSAIFLLLFTKMIFVVIDATDLLYESNIRAAMIANFSRFGFDQEAKFVVVDDERAYFMHNEAIWRCDVVDDLPLRETAKPVDLVHAHRDELKEVMAVVDIMNGVEDEDE